MPPRVRIDKKDIVDAAVNIVRIAGAGALNARSLATALGCSTQPIFSNFQSMDELNVELTKAAYGVYQSFIDREVKKERYPIYKAYGMAYICFAREESELFKLLFMCDRDGKDLSPTDDFNESVEIIMNSNGVTKEKAELMHLEMWTFVHGIAAMLATSFLVLDGELISNMLSDVYQGLRARHFSEDKQ